MTADGRSWPSAASAVVGVIGDPVAHSLSPVLHNAAFGAMGLDWVSVAFRVPPEALAGAIGGMRSLGIRGLSVTMPHKGAVTSLVDRLTPVAAALGAVNCVVAEGAALVGDNTDGEGLVAALRRGAAFDPAGRRCLVAGAGGAARAAVHALGRAGASEVVVVNRTPERAVLAAELAGTAGRAGTPEDARRAELVVEATPVGMASTEAAAADPLVPADLLHPGQVVVDLVYHPAVTRWLADAAAAGASTLGGLGMLVHQAAAQVTQWTGREAPVEAMWRAGRAALGDATG